MENEFENAGLEQMKEQLNLLKSKLDKETMINERLLRKAMKDKVSSLNHDAIVIAIVAILGIPYCTWVFASMVNVSWWFTIVTDLFMLTAVIYTYYCHKDLNAKDLLNGNLIEVSRKVARMRHLYAVWLRFSIPFIILWFAWFLFEVLGDDIKDGMAMAIGGAIGGIIGACLGIHFYRKTMKKSLEVIMQIKELTEGK